MKLKYYLRGLGIGILITTIVLMIAYSGHKTELTDEEIIQRAEALGMVMKEEPLFSNSKKDENTENVENSEISEIASETEIETETESESESEVVTTGETYHLVIPAGSVPRLICNELEENGVIESASELRQYLVDVGYATSIVVGEYDIPYGATYEEIYQILKGGPN